MVWCGLRGSERDEGCRCSASLTVNDFLVSSGWGSEVGQRVEELIGELGTEDEGHSIELRVPYQVVQVDRQQLKHNALVACMDEGVQHLHDVVAVGLCLERLEDANLHLRLLVERALRLDDLHGDTALGDGVVALDDAAERAFAQRVLDGVTVMQHLVLTDDVVGVLVVGRGGGNREDETGGGGNGHHFVLRLLPRRLRRLLPLLLLPVPSPLLPLLRPLGVVGVVDAVVRRHQADTQLGQQIGLQPPKWSGGGRGEVMGQEGGGRSGSGGRRGEERAGMDKRDGLSERGGGRADHCADAMRRDGQIGREGSGQGPEQLEARAERRWLGRRWEGADRTGGKGRD